MENVNSLSESLMKSLIDFAKNNWQLTLGVVVLAMLFKRTRRILFKLIEMVTGFQLGTFVEENFEERAAAKSRGIIKEAERDNDTIKRCKEVLASVVAQAGLFKEKAMVTSFVVREHKYPAQLKSTSTLLLLQFQY